ncbi:small VCP/p97-interacting protein isoform X2 [Cephus cinctus]|uniref:Small VCP/p97-interacting protein isoform X2 n=1 Tax=Cephus cinctus TaxID=211228 RepID=A0AAJ7FMU4_CEPCN|nr:small VCP/p97-interacting protein isoform X2 [Cephus cinctus]
MGMLWCCFPCPSSYEDLTPDPETRRRQVVEAAEKRRIEEERRGIGNLEAVRVQQQLDEERARRRAEDLNIDPQTGMKWQVN